MVLFSRYSIYLERYDKPVNTISLLCGEDAFGPAAVADRHFRPTDVGCYDPNLVSEASARCRATCTAYSIRHNLASLRLFTSGVHFPKITIRPALQ